MATGAALGGDGWDNATLNVAIVDGGLVLGVPTFVLRYEYRNGPERRVPSSYDRPANSWFDLTARPQP
jgi:hypothetical protein